MNRDEFKSDTGATRSNEALYHMKRLVTLHINGKPKINSAGINCCGSKFKPSRVLETRCLEPYYIYFYFYVF